MRARLLPSQRPKRHGPAWGGGTGRLGCACARPYQADPASRRVPSPCQHALRQVRWATRAVPGTWRRRLAPLGASQSQRSARNGTRRPRASVTDDARAAVAHLLLRGSQNPNGSRHSGSGRGVPRTLVVDPWRLEACVARRSRSGGLGGEVGDVKSVEMSSLIRGRSSRAGEGEGLFRCV